MLTQEAKTFARVHVQAGRLSQALSTYVGLLIQDPDDREALTAGGDLLRKRGRPALAYRFYLRALENGASEPGLVGRMQQCAGEWERSAEEGKLPDTPISIDELIALSKQLQGQEDVQLMTTTSVEPFLQRLLDNPAPDKLVADHLDDVYQLLPQLIQLSIAEAVKEGQNELVPGLEKALQGLSGQEAHRAQTRPFPAHSAPWVQRLRERAPVFLTGESQGAELYEGRTRLLSTAVAEMGIAPVSATNARQLSESPGLVVASVPHAHPWMMQALARYASLQVPIVVDLPLDVEDMPLAHPLYDTIGLGEETRARHYSASLLLGSRITTANSALAASYSARGYPAVYLPDGWSAGDPFWQREPPKGRAVSIGWIAGDSQLEDLVSIHRVLIRLVKELPQVRLVVVGDPRAYQLFESLPERQKAFLPVESVRELPFLLNQMDILCVPLRKNPFNFAISDGLVLAAGVKAIPWVASYTPAFEGWAAGGLFANANEEWHATIWQLVQDAHLRLELGQAGRRKAEEREAAQVAKRWFALLDELLAG